MKPALQRWKIDDERGQTLLKPIRRTSGFFDRGLGWMARRNPGEAGLWLIPCGSIHTCGMRFPLDVYFLDRACRVVRIRRNLRPWRMALGGGRAASAVETRAGALPPDAFREGDILRLSPRHPRQTEG